MIYVANWKCNLNKDLISDFLKTFSTLKNSNKRVLIRGKDSVIIAPPMPYLHLLHPYLRNGLEAAAQNISALEIKSATGEISGSMIKDLGAKYVIIGHSERRRYFAEDYNVLSAKIRRALESGLNVIFCIGESEHERKNGTYYDTLIDQLKLINNSCIADSNKLIISYEPVWAIGTGINASEEQIADVFGFIKSNVESNIRLLYGGSVNPANAKSLKTINSLDGFLIGSASLDVYSFWDIIRA